MIEYPWPETPERTEARVRGLVVSVVEPGELRSFRLEWVTPSAHQWDLPHAGRIALRVTIGAGDDEVYSQEIWGPDWDCPWEVELGRLASELEDWVCETSFAWGQRRFARVSD